MEVQLKFITKEEAHKLIDEAPGNGVVVFNYNSKKGISNYSKFIKKKKSKKLINKSSVIVLEQNNPITILNLHKKVFDNFINCDKEKIIKMILLSKGEQKSNICSEKY